MPLNAETPDGEETAGQRKDHFEAMRSRVPRYLFRAFDGSSGGGSSCSVINATEIIPRGFMNGRQVTGFYKKQEKELHAMVQAHFSADEDVLTGFSSWAASLHTVLCYAYTCSLEYEDVHVAVLDRERLDGEVRIWWVPDLLDPGEYHGEHEYLAHGCIRGPGYTAVPFEDLMVGELGTAIFPELTEWKDGDLNFGDDLRDKMFQEVLVGYYNYQTERIRRIGKLFGGLALPVMLALLTLRPRYLAEVYVPVNDAPMAREDFVDWLITSLDIQALDYDPEEELWCRPGVVYTREEGNWKAYPDVEQWIKLLRMIGERLSQRSAEEKMGGGVDGEEESGSDDREMQDLNDEDSGEEMLSDEELGDEDLGEDQLNDESDEED
ncbi:uncharacterized protein J4E84_007904 [Alternaria hordeiaustralica]|uniref:uncharacterized protein n=1 Tax=Alternaria hordeiaustralica TaxID=1187925 RepID=UPI0020C24D9A|nr:uncharacterized protein J4E84_007904 [Alternaria hordeiaustralica]KAI4680764.1 hypothetical protein J4E84_007904 [Alternaria hordeiaustralica]